MQQSAPGTSFVSSNLFCNSLKSDSFGVALDTVTLNETVNNTLIIQQVR